MLSQRAKPDPMMLKKQADTLREEVFAIEQALEENKMEALRKQQEKTDAWIEELLVQTNVTEDTQLLKSEGEVAHMAAHEARRPTASARTNLLQDVRAQLLDEDVRFSVCERH